MELIFLIPFIQEGSRLGMCQWGLAEVVTAGDEDRLSRTGVRCRCDAKPGAEQAQTILDLCFLDCSVFRPAHNTELAGFIRVVKRTGTA